LHTSAQADSLPSPPFRSRSVLNNFTPVTPCNSINCSFSDLDSLDDSSFFFRPAEVALLSRKTKFDDSFDEYWGEEGVDQDSFRDFRSESEYEEEGEEGAEVEQRKVRRVMFL